MLKIIKLLFISCLFLINSHSFADKDEVDVYSADETLIVGTTADFMPFEFFQNGEIVGFDIDLIKTIAKELGKEVLIRDMQFYSLIPALQSGDVQVVISGMSYTPERARQVDFSNPYYFNKFAMLVIGDYDKVDPIKPGMKIGVQTGTLMHQWIQKQKIDLDVVTMDGNLQLVEDLKANRLDAILFDELSAKSIIKANPYVALNLVQLAGVSDNGMSIGVQKESPLLETINQAIAKLTENGEIARIKAKWGL